jgi:hypothetical protein
MKRFPAVLILPVLEVRLSGRADGMRAFFGEIRAVKDQAGVACAPEEAIGLPAISLMRRSADQGESLMKCCTPDYPNCWRCWQG